MIDPDYVPHNNISGANYKFGKKEEKVHIDILIKAGYNIRPATSYEDRFEKVDYWMIDKHGKECGVDAKVASPETGNFCISCTRDNRLGNNVMYFSFRIGNFLYFVRRDDIQKKLSAGHYIVRPSHQKTDYGKEATNSYFYLTPNQVIELQCKQIKF